MKTALPALFLALICLVACSSNDTQVVKVKGRYSLELPAFLTKAEGLNEEASLQYQNLLQEFYVIVIDEPIKNFDSIVKTHGLENTYGHGLKGYSQLIIDGIGPAVTIDSIHEFREGKINNLNTREIEMEGKASGTDVYWKIAFIEGKSRYYQIMVWTTAENRRKHQDEIDSVIKSFRETDRSKKK